MVNGLYIPSREEFLRGIREFEKNERRDAMYRVATFVVAHFWGESRDMADGLGVLLLTWNQAWYRYGTFDFERLEDCVSRNFETLGYFRNKDIFGWGDTDKSAVESLFVGLSKALEIASGSMKGRKSPVAVAKAMHLLAPNSFPLWDKAIAQAYGCKYDVDPAGRYLMFCDLMRKLAKSIKGYGNRSDKTLLKLVDEYNYARFTQGWI